MTDEKNLAAMFGVWAGVWVPASIIQLLLVALIGAFLPTLPVRGFVSMFMLVLGGMIALGLVFLFWRGFQVKMVGAFLGFDLVTKLAAALLSHGEYLYYQVERGHPSPHGYPSGDAVSPFVSSLTYVAYVAVGYGLALLVYMPFRARRAAAASAVAPKDGGWLSVFCGLAAGRALGLCIGYIITLMVIFAGAPWVPLLDKAVSMTGIPYAKLGISATGFGLAGLVCGMTYSRWFAPAPVLHTVGAGLALATFPFLGSIRFLIAILTHPSAQARSELMYQLVVLSVTPFAALTLAFWLGSLLARPRGLSGVRGSA